MSARPLILASASPRRQELLRQLQVEFEVWPAGVEELHQEQLTARELSLLNAYRKARAVAKKFPDHTVLGADTLVCLGPRLYGKPTGLPDAARMLRELGGQTHQVVTGVCLLRLRAHRETMFAETTEVTFRPLTKEQIDAYLLAVNPLDKAGAYAIQERGGELVADVSGSYSNVVGLPLERLRQELRRLDELASTDDSQAPS
jgi:septum formation protein